MKLRHDFQCNLATKHFRTRKRLCGTLIKFYIVKPTPHINMNNSVQFDWCLLTCSDNYKASVKTKIQFETLQIQKNKGAQTNNKKSVLRN